MHEFLIFKEEVLIFKKEEIALKRYNDNKRSLFYYVLRTFLFFIAYDL